MRPTPVKVTLNDTEYAQALNVGTMRQVENRKLGRQHAYGAKPEEAEEKHIIGAVGEAIVAKYFNVFWLGVGKFRGPDVGILQVRATDLEDGRLVINKKDDDDAIFILVYVVEGVGTIRGWLRGGDGKRDEYREAHGGRPATHFVPLDRLRCISELKQEKGGAGEHDGMF